MEAKPKLLILEVEAEGSGRNDIRPIAGMVEGQGMSQDFGAQIRVPCRQGHSRSPCQKCGTGNVSEAERQFPPESVNQVMQLP